MTKKYVPTGVFLTCDKGTLPAPLNVTFNARTSINGMSLATDLDKAPGINVPPLGVCTITSMACVLQPIPGAGWSPVKDDVQLGQGHPLLEDSKLRCMASGCISIHFSLAAAQAACAPPPAPEKSLADQADDYLKTLGSPLGDYGRFQLGVAEGLWAGGKGLAEGLWGLAKGGWNAVTHPADTARAIQEGASSAYKWAGDSQNWSNAASSAGQGISSAADWASQGENWQGVGDQLQSMSPRDWGNVTGQVAFEIGLTAATAGAGTALNAAAKTSRVARMAVRVARVADVEGHALSLAGRAARSAAGRLKVLGKVVTGARRARRTERAALRAGRRGRRLEAVADCAGPKRCTRRGHPVDVATGLVFAEGFDFELPGPVPLIWSRVWYSRSTHRGQLGHGWHHAYELALTVEDDGSLALRMADGRLALFAAPQPGQGSYNRTEKLEAAGDATKGFRIWNVAERLWYVFEPSAAAEDIHRLYAVEDPNGFAIRFAYDARGHLAHITDSAGRRLPVECDAQGRILALHAPHPEPTTPGTVALVRYAYDEAGNLTSVTDALGQAIHFAYAGHLLKRETNRVGLSFYFDYDAADHTARCRRTWGDGGIYDTTLRYDSPTQTTVWDSLGQATVYTHQQGLVTTSVDPVQAVWQYTYNAHQELLLERDPLGRTTSYDYDERGNPTSATLPDGARTTTAYNAQDLPVAVTDELGNTWQWAYDAAGNQTQRLNPEGQLTISTYQNGLLHTLGAADSPPTTLRYDDDHNLRQVVLPDGQRRSWQHDALGRVTELTDARGNTQQRTYDLRGQLRRVSEPDGNVRVLTYDGEGNVVRAQDSHQDVRLEYTGLDWLAARTQAGNRVRYEYDPEGRLTSLMNARGRRHEFELDAAGQVAAEVGFGGQQRRFERDAAGQVLTQWVGEQATHYAYDAAGRVTSATYPDGAQEIFAFRSDGTLLEARNQHLTVAWERDTRGRVLRETQGEHVVESRYDQAGQRIALRSSLGAALTLERDAQGDVTQMRTADWNARFERDAQGLETARLLSGGVQMRWQHDSLGRPVRQQLTVGRGQPPRQRRYRWAGSDQLTELIDSLTGTTRFDYAADGTLATTHYPDGEQELRLPDAVGNLFRTPEQQDRHYGPAGQLQEANRTRYKYDAAGQLIRKTQPDGQQWHYGWNGAGQLVSVQRPDGYAVTFTYDALGRRIRKRFRGKVTHWVWDGNKPLHEWHELEVGPGAGSVQELTTWLFEEHSFAPAAKLTAQGVQSVVCDQVGTPLELYDGQGRKTWQAQLDSYGAVREGQGKPQDCPFRYQGQYEDVETGLYYNRFRYYDPQAGQYISPDPIGLEGGLAAYAYVADPNGWVDPFGLSKCPPTGRKPNPWNLFQRETRGKYLSRAERSAEYRHIRTGSPWPRGFTPVQEDIRVGDRIKMAMGPTQDIRRPGSFAVDAAKHDIPDVEFVRDQLAVKHIFKPEVGYVQEYEVIKSVPVLRGPIGPQLDTDLGRVLKGGPEQIEFKFPDTFDANGNKVFANRMDYLKPIGKPKIIK